MKHFDDNTKKLIKNIVSLFASALVLVAATVAWFNFADSDARTRGFRGSLQNTNSEVAYYRLETVEGVLTDAAVGTGSSAGFTFGSATLPTIPDGYMPNGLWESTTGDGSWNINSLFPGKYDAFRIDVSGSAPLMLIIRNITCTDMNGGALTAAQLETVYKNVYLYAVSVKHTTDTSVESPTTTYSVMTDLANNDVIVCDNLYNLLNGKTAEGWSISDTQTITTLNTADPAQSMSGHKTILLFVGVPGNSVTVDSGTAPDLVDEHEALRQIGAKLEFGSFAVAAG